MGQMPGGESEKRKPNHCSASVQKESQEGECGESGLALAWRS